MKQEQQTIRQIASALGISAQAARKRAAKEGWTFTEETTRGGSRRLYITARLPRDVLHAVELQSIREMLNGAGRNTKEDAVGSTPQRRADGARHVAETQDFSQERTTPVSVGSPASSNDDRLGQLAHQQAENITAKHSQNTANALGELFDAKPQHIKDRAAEHLKAVQAFHRLMATGYRRDAALEAIAAECGTSVASVQRYLAAVKGKPEHLWLYLLAPRYCGRTVEAELSAAAWEFLKADYLRRERPTAAACIARLRRAAAEHQWTLPSTRTLQRKLAELPRTLQVLAREGAKAVQQLYPAQLRDKGALSALQIINGDGYKHNLWVRFPDGEIIRAKTWFWQDVYSSKIIGWRTDKTEHTDIIRLSFGDIVEQYGIPESVVMDNTLAAANKTMSGGIKHRFRFKVREEEPLGVFPLLGVHVRWATPGHGQAKPVERLFGVGGIGEIVDKAPDFAGAWTGGNPLDKPDYDGKTRAIDLEDLHQVIEREVAAYNAREGRRSPIHKGRSFDAVFNDSFQLATIRRATEAQRRLWLLATEPVTAGRKDGALTLEAGRITRSQVAPTYANRYWAPALVEYAGAKLVARFDPLQLHTGVHVYTLDGRYITFAECHAPQGFNDANAGREHSRARKTFVRAQKQLLESEVRMDALQVAKHLPGVDRKPEDLTIPAPKVIRPEFRNPIERPTPVAVVRSADEDAFMAQLEAEQLAEATQAKKVNVFELHSDHDKHAYWLQLDARRQAGETLDDQDARFYARWQEDPYFQIMSEEEADPLRQSA